MSEDDLRDYLNSKWCQETDRAKRAREELLRMRKEERDRVYQKASSDAALKRWKTIKLCYAIIAVQLAAIIALLCVMK